MGAELRTAVVTGAGSGLGRALALELARRGADLALADIVEPGLRETAELVRGLGRRAEVLVVDVTDAVQVEGLLRLAVDTLGGVDLWVNNAGVATAGEVGDCPLEAWNRVLAVNLMGVVHGCHVVVPQLRAQGRGAILNVASAAGLVSMPGMAAYNASKAAVVALSDTLYAELRGRGVGITVLCPTFFQTNLLSSGPVGDPKLVALAARLMRRSAYSADDVARIALDDVAAGHLYSVPMADGRWLWRLRRLRPGSYQAWVSRLAPMIARFSGAKR